MNTTINLEKCKMMLDDISKVIITNSEMDKLKSVVQYTFAKISDTIDTIVYSSTPEEFNLVMAKLDNLQQVQHEQLLYRYLQTELREEFSRLIKLHWELKV